MKVIYKYTLTSRHSDIDMPQGAKILSVVVQDELAVMYALVDPSMPLETREFITIGTGGNLDVSQNPRYISTFQLRGGRWVIHIFELNPTSKTVSQVPKTASPAITVVAITTSCIPSISSTSMFKNMPLRVQGKRSKNVMRVLLNGKKHVIWKKLPLNVVNE